jgi:sec-independent protein translocase protein TatA
MLPGPGELVLILVIVVVVFGAKRIPEIMEGVGKGIKDFKRAVDADEPNPGVTQAASAQAAENKSQPK